MAMQITNRLLRRPVDAARTARSGSQQLTLGGVLADCGAHSVVVVVVAAARRCGYCVAAAATVGKRSEKSVGHHDDSD